MYAILVKSSAHVVCVTCIISKTHSIREREWESQSWESKYESVAVVRACLSNSCSYVHVCVCVCVCLQVHAKQFLAKVFFPLCVCVEFYKRKWAESAAAQRESERESTVCFGDSDCSQLFARSLKRMCVCVCVVAVVVKVNSLLT